MSILRQRSVRTYLDARTLLSSSSSEIRDMWGKKGFEGSEEKTATADA